MKLKVPFEARTSQSYLRYLDKLKHLSQKNRKIPTESEKIFWEQVLSRDKTEFRFLRQKPVGQLILDFYCSELCLAIEIDGKSHISKQNYDIARDKYLEVRGITTIRYSNDLVNTNIKNIIDDLKQKIDKRKIELNIR